MYIQISVDSEVWVVFNEFGDLCLVYLDPLFVLGNSGEYVKSNEIIVYRLLEADMLQELIFCDSCGENTDCAEIVCIRTEILVKKVKLGEDYREPEYLSSSIESDFVLGFRCPKCQQDFDYLDCPELERELAFKNRIHFSGKEKLVGIFKELASALGF